MVIMLVMVTMASAFMVLAIMDDARTLYKEYKRIECELNDCYKLIHGYNERSAKQ